MMRCFSTTVVLGVLTALGLLAVPVAATAEEPAGWGTVKGQIVFEGDKLPEAKPYNVDKDQQHCLSKGPLLSNDWVINKDNKGVRYAFVWLVADPNLKSPSKKIPIHPSLKESKDKEIVLDQPCCMFEPHCLGIREDQTLIIKNSAPIPHNSNYQGGVKNPSGNPLIPAGSQVEIKGFQVSKSPIPVSCNIHGWMKAWIRVFDSPYFAITDADGKFEIKQAPAGDYYLVVWHEQGGWRDRAEKTVGDKKVEEIGTKVTIKADGTTDLGKLGIKPAE
jgi:hypothetical protein